MEAIWLLENLPRDLVQYIIAAYNPSCLFMLDKEWLLKNDWEKQCMITFDRPHGDIFIYYNLCQRYRDHSIRTRNLRTRYGKLFNGPKICDSVDYLGILDKPVKIFQFARGNSHTVLLTSDGVLSCGSNNQGQLGLQNIKENRVFEKVNLPNNIIQVACGSHHTVVLRSDGTLMACGWNFLGQLCIGDYRDRKTFEKIDGIDDVTQIACDYNTTFILKADGTVMVSKCIIPYSFKKDPNLPKIIQIVSGDRHTAVLAIDGTAMIYGKCGDIDVNYFKKIELTDIIQITCGKYYTAALKSNGTVLICGINNFEIENLPNDIIEIAGDKNRILLMRSNGTIIIKYI